MKRRTFLHGSALWIAGTAAACLPVTRQAAAALGAADPVFNHTFEQLDGPPLELSTVLGAPVVMNFWATWCPPCVKEMPDLDALHHEFGSVRFLGMSVDTTANVREFTKKVKVSYPLLMVGHEGIALMRTLGNKVGGLPFTIVFDARGRVAERVLGQVDSQDLAQTLRELLA